MIQTVCSSCGLCILAPDTVQGRWGICFGCGARLMVPAGPNNLEERDLSFKSGARISDRYHIEAPIGRGGMGVVYRAQDSLMDEEVALKFMLPALLKTQRGQKLFIREAQVARRLRHENVVAVHDVSSTAEGILYLSMELLAGNSLRDYLRQCRQDRRLLDVRVAVTLTAQVLAALEYAHRTVVHRDMKPENVMIMPGERVKVLDFGLAKVVDQEAPEQKSKRVIGTVGYASPEQKARQRVDLRSDLYATGLIFYELLTLRTPMDEQREIAQVRQDVSPSLLKILDKARQTEPDNRWQSAGEFRSALLTAFADSYHHVAAPTGSQTAAPGKTASTESMVLQEGGSFLMGCHDIPEESPEFEASVAPFYIDIHPVTTTQYREFLEATAHPEPKFWGSEAFSGPNQPVVGVTWDDAHTYATWAGKQLPSEDQWEFAARGRANRTYPWGNNEPDPMIVNYGELLGMPTIAGMHEEGMTPEGVQDLAGNVYEWTSNLFLPYRPGADEESRHSNIPRRVVRGGCWKSPPWELRASFRTGLFPEERLDTVGFRCVLPVRTVPNP
jgi:serine/threonine protein kinase